MPKTRARTHRTHCHRPRCPVPHGCRRWTPRWPPPAPGRPRAPRHAPCRRWRRRIRTETACGPGCGSERPRSPAVGVQRGGPDLFRHQHDRLTQGLGQSEPDRVLHPPAPNVVEAGEPVQQSMGSPGAISTNQQVPAMGSRDLGDRCREHVEVISGRVGPGITWAQLGGQQFGGVVTPHPDRMKPEVALVGAAASFSLWATTMVASTSSTTTSPRSESATFEAGTPPGS